ncbi:MAG: N-acetylmuramic acid 6-phosphate etherase [Candidatus Omnitrophica bacterium]|nr:N-acetylmuramic acid 6-phosphate etherase [Candidatus Omnitrophota bacterium]
MPRAIRYRQLPTEQSHPQSVSLDRLSTLQLLQLMHREDQQAVRAVGRQLAQVAKAIALIEASLRHRGRLIFVGAGTSGRLGVIEAAECPPTFRTTPSQVQAIMAGGPRAVLRSREGAEDARASTQAMARRRIRAGDAVVGITASGVTPFVDAALRAATRRGAATILVTCHARAPIPADVRIAVVVGPELLAGSTRLKAGTATKLILNMLTLGAMARLGKTYGSLMVDVRPTSRKLTARAIAIIQLVTHVSPRVAAARLRAARGNVKAAIVMASHHVSLVAARRRLSHAHGSLRKALSSQPLNHSITQSLNH